VDTQTTAFQAQCEDLLNDQKRTLALADGIADNLQYYTYLEPMTRRLNAPGAGRLAGGRDFSEMLSNLDACLEYMQAHVCPASMIMSFILICMECKAKTSRISQL
jgi:hypothetical protein